MPSAVLSLTAVLLCIFGLKRLAQDGVELLPLVSILCGLGFGAVFVRRQLTLVGSGVTDYLDPVLPADAVPAIREQLQQWDDWDVCDWQDLSRDTPLQALGNVKDEIPCSAIELTGTFEQFLAARPKDLRRNLRRYRDKAEALGPVTFQPWSAPDFTLPTTQGGRFALEEARQKHRGVVVMFYLGAGCVHWVCAST